jgi:hypothetical protein
MTFRQQQPVTPSVPYQPPTRLHQPQLQTGQRPVIDLFLAALRATRCITLGHSRTRLDQKQWRLSRVIFAACLPSLIHYSAFPHFRKVGCPCIRETPVAIVDGNGEGIVRRFFRSSIEATIVESESGLR